MTCNRISGQLDDYLDRRLDDVARRRFEEHVDHCPECRHTVHRAQILQQALRDYPVQGPTQDFFHRALTAAAEWAGVMLSNSPEMNSVGTSLVGSALISAPSLSSPHLSQTDMTTLGPQVRFATASS